MSRADAMWVGLKLLGAYFVIVGLSEAGYAAWSVLSFEAREEETGMLTYLRKEQHRQLLGASVKVIGGLLLLIVATPFGRKSATQT